MKLTVVRVMHSAVFLVELAAILWLVVTGIVGRRDRTVAVAGGLVAAEAAVFVANSGVCPRTPLADAEHARIGGRHRPAGRDGAHDADLVEPFVAIGIALRVRHLGPAPFGAAAAVSRRLGVGRSHADRGRRRPDHAWIASSVIRRAWMRQITRVSRACCSAG